MNFLKANAVARIAKLLNTGDFVAADGLFLEMEDAFVEVIPELDARSKRCRLRFYFGSGAALDACSGRGLAGAPKEYIEGLRSAFEEMAEDSIPAVAMGGRNGLKMLDQSAEQANPCEGLVVQIHQQSGQQGGEGKSILIGETRMNAFGRGVIDGVDSAAVLTIRVVWDSAQTGDVENKASLKWTGMARAAANTDSGSALRTWKLSGEGYIILFEELDDAQTSIVAQSSDPALNNAVIEFQLGGMTGKIVLKARREAGPWSGRQVIAVTYERAIESPNIRLVKPTE